MKIENNLEYNDDIQEDIRNRTEKLNDDLKVRQESISLLKVRLQGSKKQLPQGPLIG